MPLNARIAHNSLAGAIVACAAILAAGCGSHSSAGSQPASSPSGSQSGAASASATASASAAQATSQAPTAPASGTAASAPSCSTSSLHITLANGGAGAGTDFTVLEFTNGGSSACTIYGFPGVSLTNSAGAQIGAAATRNPSRASALITLAPGAQANATLGVANAENYPATACKPTTAAKLKVYPPNQTQSAELPFTVTGCAVSATHQLSVTAVTVGAGQTVP